MVIAECETDTEIGMDYPKACQSELSLPLWMMHRVSECPQLFQANLVILMSDHYYTQIFMFWPSSLHLIIDP